jgi:hypothetical protein
MFSGWRTQRRYQKGFLGSMLKQEIEIEDGGALTGCICISSSMQDGKVIPMATPIFSLLGNSRTLLGRINVKTGSQKFKIAAT